MPQACTPETEYPALHEYVHVLPVTPLHVVGELATVSPLVHRPAVQLPPENEPPALQTCAPDGPYPALQVYAHVSAVTPEHVVGESASVSPPLQLAPTQLPPKNDPPAPQT